MTATQVSLKDLIEEIGILFDNTLVVYAPDFDFDHRTDLVYHAITVREEQRGIYTIGQWAQAIVETLLAQMHDVRGQCYWRRRQFPSGGLDVMIWGYIS